MEIAVADLLSIYLIAYNAMGNSHHAQEAHEHDVPIPASPRPDRP